jgi:hypothetical protein
MNIFREYLHEWEFDDVWRGFVVRLAEICDTAEGKAREALESCAMFERGAEHGMTPSLLVWVDVAHVNRNAVALTLAGLIDQSGMRCGTVNSHSVHPTLGADLTWTYSALQPDKDPAELAEPFAEWLTATAQRPVEELLALDRSN